MYKSNMRIVPSVIVNQRSPVGHAGNLISIIPPRHNGCIFISVLPKPIVCFTKIIQNITRSAKYIIVKPILEMQKYVLKLCLTSIYRYLT